jgi:hypothetical protein
MATYKTKYKHRVETHGIFPGAHEKSFPSITSPLTGECNDPAQLAIWAQNQWQTGNIIKNRRRHNLQRHSCCSPWIRRVSTNPRRNRTTASRRPRSLRHGACAGCGEGCERRKWTGNGGMRQPLSQPATVDRDV